MNKIVDISFDRVEKALAALVNSIANYTANPQAADGLVKADADMIGTLQLLDTHQKNHALVLQKRAYSNSLDTLIRDSLTTLIDTRKELLATPATKFKDDKEYFPVHYHELLAYARRISAFTMPPGGYKEHAVEKVDGSQLGVEETALTPATDAGKVTASTPGGSTAAVANEYKTTMPEAWHAYIHPQEGMVSTWVPYPEDDNVRRGALATMQFVADMGGEEAAAVALDGATGMAEAAREEESRKEREKEEMVRMEVERARGAAAAQAQASALVQQSPQPKQRQAQVFAGLDALDDDDDED